MTQLEKDILKAIENVSLIVRQREYTEGEDTESDYPGMAQAAASVCKRYVEKAFRENPALKVQEMCGMVTEDQLLVKFLQDNGISEPEQKTE